MENNKNIMVSVVCMAYNHGKYIKQALDSILCQKTNFEYEVLVNDDCSTDDTPDILRNYEKTHPNLHVIYQTENQYSKGVRMLPELVKISRGRYIAFNECDDYFCDPQKLQKQVDILEQNEQCVACIHSSYRVSEEGEVIGHRKPYIQEQIMGLKEIIPCVGRLYSLNSLLCRKEALDFSDLYKKCRVGDIPIALTLAFSGNFYYLDEDLSAYRVAANGSWSVRMKGNNESANKNMDNFIEVLHYLDELTKGKYAVEIQERIDDFTFGKSYINKDFFGFVNKKYKKYRLAIPVKQRIGFYLRCIEKKIRG